MKRELTFTDIVLLCCRKYKVFLTAGVILAAIIGCYIFLSTQGASSAQINNVLLQEQELDRLFAEKAEIDKYIQNSLVYSLNQYSVGIGEINIFISTDYVQDISIDMEFQEPSMIEALVSAYTMLARDTNICNDIKNIIGQPDIDDFYIYEIFNIYATEKITNAGAHMRIYATHGDAETAKNICDYLYANLPQRVTSVVGEHTAKITSELELYRPELNVGDNKVIWDTRAKEKNEEIDTVSARIQGATFQPISFSGKAIRAAKYSFVGLVVGIIGTFIIYLTAWLLSDKLITTADIQKRYGYPILGRIDHKR